MRHVEIVPALISERCLGEMTENRQSVLEAARRLSSGERRFLIEQLKQETVAADENASQARAGSLTQIATLIVIRSLG